MKIQVLIFGIFIGLLSISFIEKEQEDFLLSLTKTDNNKNFVTALEKINFDISNLYQNKSIWWRDTISVSDNSGFTEISENNDIIFKKRIKKLDRKTPIKLEYNEFVFNYIEAYGVLNKEKLENIMAVSSYYFPIFEEYLAKYNLPIELKYLAAVESALDPNAISVSGAVGLWQFMKHTSDIFGIEVSSYIDERRDVYKSTDAACAYLEYLYRTFNDWQLALAAYNGGPGMVVKAIARSGGKTDYWELRPYMTDQMQNYVSAFIAMTYLMNYHAEHNIFPNENYIDFYAYDTLHITGPLDFKQIEYVTGLSADSIRLMNPVFIKNKIPDNNKIYTLVLPRDYMLKFLINQNKIYFYKPHIDNYFDLKEKAGDTLGRGIYYHKVIRGETLHQIAIRYNVTINNIFAWNKLPDNYILRFDDILKIWIEEK